VGGQAFPDVMKAPWRSECAEIRMHDLEAKSITEFKKYAGPSPPSPFTRRRPPYIPSPSPSREPTPHNVLTTMCTRPCGAHTPCRRVRTHKRPPPPHMPMPRHGRTSRICSEHVAYASTLARTYQYRFVYQRTHAFACAHTHVDSDRFCRANLRLHIVAVGIGAGLSCSLRGLVLVLAGTSRSTRARSSGSWTRRSPNRPM
jgi:hypothetical protein